MNYNWPLNVSNYSLMDKINLCGFVLNPKNFWTQNKKVEEFESKMANFMGYEYGVFCSSGSTANTMLAMYTRDRLNKENDKRNIVVLPSTTWTTSCSPWIREGFDPRFIDISLDNFGMDLYKLEEYLSLNHESVAVVFPTCLLGFNIDYYKLHSLRKMYPKIKFFVDQCENNFAKFGLYDDDSRLFTCTTSTYMGHEIQSVEGGFVFTNNKDEYNQFLMYRNHGMVRSIKSEEDKEIFLNDKVDSRFDFYNLGNNFRNSDINAFLGILDLKRRFKYIAQRRMLYGLFQKKLNRDRYLLPYDSRLDGSWHVPFCLPIITKGETALQRIGKIKHYCIDNNIETRPIISGFLGYQTAYQQFFHNKQYPNSIFLHMNGIYVGLNSKVKESYIIQFTDYLNAL